MDGVKLPPPEMRQVFGTRLQWVEYIIHSALRRAGNVGMTTRELAFEVLKREGAASGSLRDNFRATREGSESNQEVRAALAVMLLDGKVRCPSTHPNVWHLTDKGRG